MHAYSCTSLSSPSTPLSIILGWNWFTYAYSCCITSLSSPPPLLVSLPIFKQWCLPSSPWLQCLVCLTLWLWKMRRCNSSSWSFVSNNQIVLVFLLSFLSLSHHSSLFSSHFPPASWSAYSHSSQYHIQFHSDIRKYYMYKQLKCITAYM